MLLLASFVTVPAGAAAPWTRPFAYVADAAASIQNMPAIVPATPPATSKAARRRRGTLTLMVRGARNLKAPTPELLGGRILARPLRDCVLVATPAASSLPASWESLAKPALSVAPIWQETMVFEGVPCPAPGDHPPLRLHLLYRDVSGQPVARWEALPIDPDTWRAALTSAQERWLPLYTTRGGTPESSPTKSRSPTPVVAAAPGARRGSMGSISGSPSKQQQQHQARHAYVGDLLVAIHLIPYRPAARLRYRRPWREAARVLQLPPQLLLPDWLRGSLVGAIGWFTDGLLEASEALRLVPRQRAPSAAAAARALKAAGEEEGEEDEEMAHVPRLTLLQKIFYLSSLFMALASVSLGASLSLAVAAALFPVVTLLVAGSLLAVVGLGLPAFCVVAFILSAPPVRRRLLEPAILRFRWSRALFLEAAPAVEAEGAEGAIGMEEVDAPAEKAAA